MLHWVLSLLSAVKRPIGIDPTKGVGTAYEGNVRVGTTRAASSYGPLTLNEWFVFAFCFQIPRPGGIRKGWVRQFVVVCDFKLFLYDVHPERNNAPSAVVNQVVDMRDEGFAVSSVSEADVIHANKKDINCIFKVETSAAAELSSQQAVLMLADSEHDKRRWVGALGELHKVLRKNAIPDKSVGFLLSPTLP